MIDRDEMLRLVRRERDDAENGYAVSQSGSEAVTVWRRRADVLLAIENLIRTAPDPEKVKRLVDAANDVLSSTPEYRDNYALGPSIDKEYRDDLIAALAEVEGDKPEKDGGK